MTTLFCNAPEDIVKKYSDKTVDANSCTFDETTPNANIVKVLFYVDRYIPSLEYVNVYIERMERIMKTYSPRYFYLMRPNDLCERYVGRSMSYEHKVIDNFIARFRTMYPYTCFEYYFRYDEVGLLYNILIANEKQNDCLMYMESQPNEYKSEPLFE